MKMASLPPMMALAKEIGKAFNHQASDYDRVAVAQHEIGERLLSRLQYMKLVPKRILDLGCGTGSFTRQLRLKYPKAQVIGLDLAFDMLLQAQKKQTWRKKWNLVLADMAHLPFENGLFDLVFANQVLHWGSMQEIFRELNRVMKPNACLMFSTLGPDTFKEIKLAWSGVNHYAHVNEFVDMHDVGDLLLAEQFVEPVVDMEMLTLHYKSVALLAQSLKRQGVKNVHRDRNKGLTSKAAWDRFEKNYQSLQTEQGKYPLSYEVIYGQAWKSAPRQIQQGDETWIPISGIRRHRV